MQKKVQNLVVDTNAFINNAPIQDIGENIYTIQEVIDEVTSKRQLRHLSVLAYDLVIKDVFVENIKHVTDFSKKTGDYSSLSATDLKVIALAYQLEKEKCGVEHLNDVPSVQKSISAKHSSQSNSIGFFQPQKNENPSDTGVNSDDSPQNLEDESLGAELDENELNAQLQGLKVECDDILVPVKEMNDVNNTDDSSEQNETDGSDENDSSESDGEGWITVSNITQAKKDFDADLTEDATSIVACMTADFAMQNVLKQIGLKVAAYDGRLIRRVRTFILRCFTCFKTTSVMSKQFCPNCGHSTLKKVAVTLDENGQQQIHINIKRPLTGRGKRFSLPAPKGGQHAQNPRLTEDQPGAFQRPTRLARTKNNPLNPDYIAGYSPFVMRDVNSKSAVLGIRSGDVKNWMRKNPNEVRRKKK